MDKTKVIDTYCYSEGLTANGQLLKFTCRPDEIKEVKDFLENNIRTISIPVTKDINNNHVNYGKYTRYDIIQHKYNGGGTGYGEMLEIINPPDGRCGFVIHEFIDGKNSYFTEWNSLEEALNAYRRYWYCEEEKAMKLFLSLSGFIRKVDCGVLTPWFYAIGDEVLVGDYVFPDGIQDDPVFRFGTKFVVYDRGGVPCIKTCMGTRFFEKKDSHPPYEMLRFKMVYWNDGSVYDEKNTFTQIKPRLLLEDELWITEAVHQFQKLLAGNTSEFSIDFTDGHKFVGKFVKSNPQLPCAEGDYLLTIKLKGDDKPIEGWCRNFVPSKKSPDIIAHTKRVYEEKDKEVEWVEIKESKVKPGGKKWSGAYFAKKS